MPLLESLLDKRSELIAAARRHGASNIRLFGSVVRGEETPSSDVDLLIDLSEERGFDDYLALAEELEALIGRKVDLVTSRGVSPFLRLLIEREALPL
ncbi:nucleotidyltransferase domain-containing protein [Methylocystis sp. JR02]|uniref:nucleotidyltransferase family protein n=1 Tax=Methylocystis sp. JR02 TaxID=3046284 RepID=UPI0024BADE9E|nr:nucleotidyltransferase domain-containing protein [Methylocystis sp. JR02]MDJ0448749.1 nucleotidyltransferase domain-containing protein [Methylocystis sp. JR02]